MPFVSNPNNLMRNPVGPGTSSVSPLLTFPMYFSLIFLYQHYSASSNPPEHPSVLPVAMPKIWALPDHRRLLQVPHQMYYDPLHPCRPTVTFSTRGWPGVRVRDILNRTAMVDAPYDMPFLSYGWRTTKVFLEVSLFPRALFHYY